MIFQDPAESLDPRMSVRAIIEEPFIGLFGNEMHSPIMAIGNGIPALVCRWETQTTKGLMWRDLGLDDWLFDFDQETEVARLPAAVLAMAKDPAGARAKAAHARAKAAELHRGMAGQVARAAS